jgi:peroxiredoxin
MSRLARCQNGDQPFLTAALAAHSLNLLENIMLKIGDKLPAVSLKEFIEVEGNGCSLGPNSFEVPAITAGKKIAMFALPGAFTPTCSAKHLPGYVEHHDALRALGVDEIWCISVNDAFVMGAWGREQNTSGKVRMMADGNGDFTKAVGLTVDLSAHGMGHRSQRYSMLVIDGVVKSLNIEGPGKFELSDAATMLKQAQQLLA